MMLGSEAMILPSMSLAGFVIASNCSAESALISTGTRMMKYTTRPSTSESRCLPSEAASPHFSLRRSTPALASRLCTMRCTIRAMNQPMTRMAAAEMMFGTKANTLLKSVVTGSRSACRSNAWRISGRKIRNTSQ